MRPCEYMVAVLTLSSYRVEPRSRFLLVHEYAATWTWKCAVFLIMWFALVCYCVMEMLSLSARSCFVIVVSEKHDIIEPTVESSQYMNILAVYSTNGDGFDVHDRHSMILPPLNILSDGLSHLIPVTAQWEDRNIRNYHVEQGVSSRKYYSQRIIMYTPKECATSMIANVVSIISRMR